MSAIVHDNMLAGTGLDVVHIADVRRARFKRRLAEYFLTNEELESLPNNDTLDQFLASRFALKEAVIKAFPSKLTAFDFSVRSSGHGPTITFCSNELNERYVVHASLTHTKELAMAVAIVDTRA